jgi:hypothetical protein
VNRGSRPTRRSGAHLTTPEHNALVALGIERWKAVDETQILRSLLVQLPYVLFESTNSQSIKGGIFNDTHPLIDRIAWTVIACLESLIQGFCKTGQCSGAMATH